MIPVPVRSYDDLQAAPALATLPALSACIEAFVAALDVAHPCLLSSPRHPISERETTALLIHMHLDACQHLLHLYDQLTFDGSYWYCPEHDQQHDDELNHDPEDDIPF